MPPLICGSPVLLDHSFPRDRKEIAAVAITLGEIQRQLRNDDVHLILTSELTNIIQSFDWESRTDDPHLKALLRDIWRYLNEWFLTPHNRLIQINLSDVKDYKSHPTPKGCSTAGLVEIWADEVGRLLTLHDKCCPKQYYFIGIACEQAYSGLPPNTYDNPKQRCFPLVGPKDIQDRLIDAYDWQKDSNTHRQKVYVKDFLNNYKAIGGISNENPNKGSHCQIKFRGKRTWTLDVKIDPIPDKFLRELIPITGYPLDVIKYVLLNGCIPELILRLPVNS